MWGKARPEPSSVCSHSHHTQSTAWLLPVASGDNGELSAEEGAAGTSRVQSSSSRLGIAVQVSVAAAAALVVVLMVMMVEAC